MANRNILTISTSAGGFDALRFLARSFPADFPAAVLVSIHLAEGSQRQARSNPRQPASVDEGRERRESRTSGDSETTHDEPDRIARASDTASS
jgi:chemotaxis response regulator CheB